MQHAPISIGSGGCWGRIGIIIFLMAVGSIGSAVAQPRPDVTSWIEPDTVVSGEPFTFNVTANTPAHRAVWFPDADADSSVFGPLTVLRRSEVHTRPVGVMYAIDSVAYTVTTAAQDSVRIPPIPIRVDAATDTVVTQTQPFTVPVVTRNADPMLSVSAPASVPSERVGWGLLGLAVVAGLGGALYVWRRVGVGASSGAAAVESSGSDHRRRPYEQARAELEPLQKRDLEGAEAVESVYVALSGTISDYLSRRLEVAARERTTSEVLGLLRRHEQVPQSAARRLREVLEKADLVKFAGRRPAAGMAREHVREALATLESIEKGLPAESETDSR